MAVVTYKQIIEFNEDSLQNCRLETADSYFDSRVIFHSEQLVHLSHLGSFKPLLSCSSVTHKFIVRFVTKSKTDLPSCNLKLLLISGPCFLSSSPYPKDYFRSRNSMHQSICFLSLERDLVLFLLCHLTFV